MSAKTYSSLWNKRSNRDLGVRIDAHKAVLDATVMTLPIAYSVERGGGGAHETRTGEGTVSYLLVG